MPTPTNAQIVAAVSLFEALIRENPRATNASSQFDNVNGLANFAAHLRPELRGLSAGSDEERTYIDHDSNGNAFTRDPRADRLALLAELANT